MLTAICLLAIGCSGSTVDTASPDIASVRGTGSGNSHCLWGLWQGHIDPVAQTVEFTQLRGAEFHLNALPFLEPPVLVNLSLDSLEFNGDIIEADIGLRHPFLGLTEFTGFDVCGIFISNGSVSGFSDADLVMAGDGDTRLMNPDGYTRWWNPAEFPSNGTIFGYVDGLLGVPDSVADFNCTLNGYKYYCDDLDDPDDALGDVTLENRGMFSAGQKNVRHFTLQLGADGLMFNYAVDANWTFPEGDPPWMAPDDFPAEANRPEAWNISVSADENSLWNDGESSGGDLGLVIDVYDWYNADMNTITVESAGSFDPETSATATGGGEGYSTYEIDIIEATPAPDAEGNIELFITVASEDEGYGGMLEGKFVSSYFKHTVPVGDEAPTTLKNMDIRPGYEIVDFGIRETTGESYVVFNDGQLWFYNEDYSDGGTPKLVYNTDLDFIDALDNGDACAGDANASGQYIYFLATNTTQLWGYTGNMMDVTETDPPGLGDRAYFWQNAGTYILSSRRTPTAYGGNIAGFYIVGSGPGLVDLAAFRALHTSRDNADEDMTMWCYALEGAPEFAIERYDYYATGGAHSAYYDLTICGTQGNGQYELNRPQGHLRRRKRQYLHPRCKIDRPAGGQGLRYEWGILVRVRKFHHDIGHAVAPRCRRG